MDAIDEPTVVIESLDPTMLSDLIDAFPELRQSGVPKPSNTPATEDREVGTLILAIELVKAGIELTTAVLTFLSERGHPGRTYLVSMSSDGSRQQTVLYDPDRRLVLPVPKIE